MAIQSILPGQSDALRRSRMRDALLKVAKKHDKYLKQVITEQIDLTIDELRIETPKATGAAAGTTQGARKPMYRSHPGFGRTIGNAPGDTGWQPYEADNGKHWAIINPMWQPYLAVVNYTHIAGGFVDRAARNLRQRLLTLKKANI